jgi:hypothetical protein
MVRTYTARVRPTASVRRRGYKHATSLEQQVVKDSCQEIEDPRRNVVDISDDDADVNGFSGGPTDISILKPYRVQVINRRPCDEVVMYCLNSCCCVCSQNNL